MNGSIGLIGLTVYPQKNGDISDCYELLGTDWYIYEQTGMNQYWYELNSCTGSARKLRNTPARHSPGTVPGSPAPSALLGPGAQTQGTGFSTGQERRGDLKPFTPK